MLDLAGHVARELRKIGVRVDWKATFEAFVQVHGGLPVKVGGRLLFADGWGHALDYRGPEFPPPRNDSPEGAQALAHLKLIYQQHKRRALKMEVDWLEGIVGAFDEAQGARSAPIQHRRKLDERDEHGNPTWGTGPMDDPDDDMSPVANLRRRLNTFSRPELQACEALLEEMEYPVKEQERTESR